MDRQTDGQTDRWMDGQMDNLTQHDFDIYVKGGTSRLIGWLGCLVKHITLILLLIIF